jgi:hypothetical protein
MITLSALVSCGNVSIKLVPDMYSCFEVCGVSIVVAALLPEATCDLVKQPQLSISQSLPFEMLSDIVKEDERLGFLSLYCSEVVCDRLSLVDGWLECTNLRTVVLCKSMAPIYYPVGLPCEVFDLFCFFELRPGVRGKR